MVAGVFCTARCSRSEGWEHRKNDSPKTSCSRILDISCPYNTSNGFSWAMFSVRMPQTTVLSLERLILLFLFVVSTPHHHPGSKHGTGSLGFRWSYAENFGFLGQTAPTFVTRVSLQVYRKPITISTTNPLPAEFPMFSVMKCLQPTHIAERANGYHVFAQSNGRSLCAVALAVGPWSSSMITSLFWRPARGALFIHAAGFKFARTF